MSHIITHSDKIITHADKGKAIRLNGTTQRVTYTNASAFNFSGMTEFTLEIGFSLSSHKKTGVLFSKGGGNTNDTELLLILETSGGNPTLTVYMSSGTTMYIQGSQTILPGRYYWASVKREANTLAVSINYQAYGIPVNISSNIYSSTLGPSIGAYGAYPGSFSDWLGVDIREIRVWNTARSQTAIVADRGKLLTGAETGLTFLTRFNGNANDLTANANNGTLINTPKFIPNTAFDAPAVSGPNILQYT